MAASWRAASLLASRLSSAWYAAGRSAVGSFATHLCVATVQVIAFAIFWW